MPTKRKGYWADHLYSRRNVEFGVTEFVGWQRIIDLVRRAKVVGDLRAVPSGDRDAALIACLFIGGFRSSEGTREYYTDSAGNELISGVRRDQVKVLRDVENPHILFDGVMALKGHRKIKGTDRLDETGRRRWKTIRIPLYRVFPVPLTEPSAVLDPFLHWVDGTPEGENLFPITPTRVWQIVEDVDPTVWPHWFRAQRASQLAREYGFDLHALMEFFQWKDPKTAVRYASMGYQGLLSRLPTKPVARIM